ncbi:LOW QUALITY PROTEIN: putative f-box and wd40 domain protein 7 (fbw7) [Schistosoma mansoni]|uniref:putative f-box and wd40 domain protein 7 (fbw7) n=1 Tax=Schistosoma mansoni TaxID=6183 RepID=UPI00022DC691|nr:LOW QUALITY PROTEIN: putative f-box and wd40 domain protein 7 (fbw7) [Schistosoma mansoni]|eukprot:XP_018648758.1 LOW QUALITY PROTEIN: putative f-box and wd40 domain protein 7 (fbw7) [Schistosoma mansoni]
MIQTKSSWTPLVNKDANKTLFEERKNLILAWFAKWSESQRKELMTKLLELCTQKQLESLFHNIEDKIPLYQLDFTRILPRVLCIYLFSFLDPRSLCRCAQVSWYWRYLTESNELWASKCLRYGWDLIASHSQWEPGIWKKHYIQNIRYLQFHNSEKLKTIHKSIYPNLSAFTNHHHSITITLENHIHLSFSYPDHNTDKMQQLQYRMIKKDSNPDSHLKNNSKFHKIENNESSIHKLQSNHSKLNGSNKQLNHEIDMVN